MTPDQVIYYDDIYYARASNQIRDISIYKLFFFTLALESLTVQELYIQYYNVKSFESSPRDHIFPALSNAL